MNAGDRWFIEPEVRKDVIIYWILVSGLYAFKGLNDANKLSKLIIHLQAHTKNELS